MNKNLNKELSVGTTDNSITKDQDMHVSPAITNANVVCSLSSQEDEIKKVRFHYDSPDTFFPMEYNAETRTLQVK